MKALVLLATLALAAAAVPLASAGHTYNNCMNVWYPQPPPGWHNVCTTTDWWAHNPFTPLVNCLVAPLEVSVIGVKYDLAEGLACV